ncbi:predicted protein [Naegleria gruberi]|uniref:Predicted protein n=1 Tax=Naegleria gruberi TaxID=5762 RepID=D2VJ43_NAEGR|nr:uncharacterized protein NAEGRDRAFT_68901 [Naegleria gruberi]EFC43213.1 predicted protein [Naegleria gruberi]|eukprot:XP_002675957.1 predicted protein [Naegleria gruberi strain NEG-M]
MFKVILAITFCYLAAAYSVAAQWGTVNKPFSVNSLWNSRPVNPILSGVTVPASTYFPTVQGGAYSTGVYVASATDQPMTVYGPSATVGIKNVDIGGYVTSMVIPRWPANAVPATGSDGHCEIYDPIAKVIHSFWQLKNVTGVWRATLYGWAALDGTGWGDPAHYYQGARAVGIVSSAGIIRKHEVDDGDVMYRHALALSLTYNALANGSNTYVFPATSADGDASTTNYGAIPEGSLLMLPSSFNASKLTTQKLRKVAETLKTYGARVVDRNVGTPYAIYVEIGANYSLHPPGGWSNTAASELQTIREALRPLVSASSWLNGNGQPVTFSQNQNLLSMRGPWTLQSGDALGVFDTYQQAVVFPSKSARVTQTNSNGTGFAKLNWAKPIAGQSYNLTAITTGGGQLRLSFNLDCSDSTKVINSGALNNGQSFVFTWPASNCWHTLYAISGLNQASSVSASLIKV